MSGFLDEWAEFAEAAEALNTAVYAEIVEPIGSFGLRLTYRVYARLAQIVAYFNVPK